MARRRASPEHYTASLLLCLAISLIPACARSGAVHHTEAAANSPGSEQKLPFHQNPDHATDDSAHPSVPAERKAESGTPFLAAAHRRSLPAGTLITVRLDDSLSISNVRPGDMFTASVAGPIASDGNTLIERGAPVRGRVESAQPSVDRPGLSPDPGYVRLTLYAIIVDGRALDLQTSSLFAKGTFQSSGLSSTSSSAGRRSAAPSHDLRVQKGRRLTFRLTAPVTFADPNSVADRQDPNTSANR
jgi:hypothetical protein